jgi:hypothetical protein
MELNTQYWTVLRAVPITPRFPWRCSTGYVGFPKGLSMLKLSRSTTWHLFSFLLVSKNLMALVLIYSMLPKGARVPPSHGNGENVGIWAELSFIRSTLGVSIRVDPIPLVLLL